MAWARLAAVALIAVMSGHLQRQCRLCKAVSEVRPWHQLDPLENLFKWIKCVAIAASAPRPERSYDAASPRSVASPSSPQSRFSECDRRVTTSNNLDAIGKPVTCETDRAELALSSRGNAGSPSDGHPSKLCAALALPRMLRMDGKIPTGVPHLFTRRRALTFRCGRRAESARPLGFGRGMTVPKVGRLDSKRPTTEHGNAS